MGVPPVDCKYQSTCKPAAAVTLNAGIGAPWHTDGLLGFDAGVTVGQLQLGEVTIC